MRLNKRLILKSPKRQPDDLNKELNALEWQKSRRKFFNIFKCIEDAIKTFIRRATEIIQPVFDSMCNVLRDIENENMRSNTTNMLPELPKLQRFRNDLL